MKEELNVVITKDVGIFSLYCEELKTNVEGQSISEVVENFVVEVNEQYNDYVISSDEKFICGVPELIKKNQEVLKWIFENQE